MIFKQELDVLPVKVLTFLLLMENPVFVHQEILVQTEHVFLVISVVLSALEILACNAVLE